MKFDAIEQRKQQEQKKPRKVRKELARLTKVYPVAGTKNEHTVKITIRGKEVFAYFLDTKKYDLELLDEKKADFVTENYWRFHRQYASSLKEIFMNFPEDTQKQQAYIRYKRDRAKNVSQMRILQTELEKMKYIEKEYKKFASYLVIYGETEKELNENFAIIKRFSELFEPQLLKRDQIKKILALLNNTGGVMLSDEKENSH